MSIRHALLPPHLTLRASRRRTRTTTLICALVSMSTALLAGCGSNADKAPAASVNPSTSSATSVVTVEKAWVKTADGGMTAVFGELRNSSGSPVTVTAATTSASSRAELHEAVMVDGTMQMRPKKGGFVIPPGGTHQLAPGGDHIMVMDIKRPIRPGDMVDVTLFLANGSTAAFSALGKQSSGGNETYAPSPTDMPGMKMPSSTTSSSAGK
ncbi:MAG: copper chaperone PCu(A)C [Dermatophilaceae bacterium]